MSFRGVALVIGGTGMLAGLTTSLAQDYSVVGVVGRASGRLTNLTDSSNRIVAIQTDYSNLDKFDAALGEFAKKYGKVDLVVSWIHSSSPDAPLLAASYCAADFYDITGSSGADPDHISRQRQIKIEDLGVNYHRVILGSISDRWLNNQEISDGVHAAVASGAKEHIVGEA